MTERHGHHNHHDDKDDDHCVPCFIAGSKVVTNKGLIDVKDVVVGTEILTRDNGFKEVLWVGSAIGTEWVQFEKTRVSPNHRMLLTDPEEHLVAAKKLVGSKRMPGKMMSSEVTFVHFMFDQHEIVNVDETWSESFRPGEWILENMKQDQADEIKALFPEFKSGIFQPLARNELKSLAD